MAQCNVPIPATLESEPKPNRNPHPELRVSEPNSVGIAYVSDRTHVVHEVHSLYTMSYLVLYIFFFPSLRIRVPSATEVGRAPFGAAGLARQTPSIGGCTQRNLRFVVTTGAHRLVQLSIALKSQTCSLSLAYEPRRLSSLLDGHTGSLATNHPDTSPGFSQMRTSAFQLTETCATFRSASHFSSRMPNILLHDDYSPPHLAGSHRLISLG